MCIVTLGLIFDIQILLPSNNNWSKNCSENFKNLVREK